jgi:hypothetical protein
MTPLDTLRAALELVEQQLAAATPGPWALDDDGNPERDQPILDRKGEYIGHSPDDGVRAGFDAADATLIVTGVNLLPVVRDILADAIKSGTDWQDPERSDAPDDYFQDYHPDALRLARAIVKDSDLT